MADQNTTTRGAARVATFTLEELLSAIEAELQGTDTQYAVAVIDQLDNLGWVVMIWAVSDGINSAHGCLVPDDTDLARGVCTVITSALSNTVPTSLTIRVLSDNPARRALGEAAVAFAADTLKPMLIADS